MIEIDSASKDEIEASIKELENRKADLIEKIKKLNGRLRYKQYEQKALEPFLEQTKGIRIGPLRKRLRELEFRISTQAFTPKIEKELIKEVKKTEQELAKVADIEKARRKKMLVDGDVMEVQKQISDLEPELKKIRDELNDHYDSLRASRRAGIKHEGQKNDHMVTLEEVVVFEKQ